MINNETNSSMSCTYCEILDAIGNGSLGQIVITVADAATSIKYEDNVEFSVCFSGYSIESSKFLIT